MSVAVTGAVLIGQYPEAAMVMVLFNLSEAIEAKSFGRARNAIRELLSLTPETAAVLRADGVWEDMDARQVPVGARVRVRPGVQVEMTDGQPALAVGGQTRRARGPGRRDRRRPVLRQPGPHHR